MMAARIALVLSAALLCLVLGLVSAPSAPALVVPAHPLRLAELRLDPPGEAAAAAATALAGGAPPPAPVAPHVGIARVRPAVAAPAPPPPPPGADEVLRSSVAAVSDDGGRLSLVLADGGRRLRPGETFMGWTVASVSRTGAVLTKGGEHRDVSFFGPRRAPDASASAATEGAAARPVPALTSPARVAPMPKAPTAEEFFRGYKG